MGLSIASLISMVPMVFHIGPSNIDKLQYDALTCSVTFDNNWNKNKSLYLNYSSSRILWSDLKPTLIVTTNGVDGHGNEVELKFKTQDLEWQKCQKTRSK